MGAWYSYGLADLMNDAWAFGQNILNPSDPQIAWDPDTRTWMKGGQPCCTGGGGATGSGWTYPWERADWQGGVIPEWYKGPMPSGRRVQVSSPSGTFNPPSTGGTGGTGDTGGGGGSGDSGGGTGPGTGTSVSVNGGHLSIDNWGNAPSDTETGSLTSGIHGPGDLFTSSGWGFPAKEGTCPVIKVPLGNVRYQDVTIDPCPQLLTLQPLVQPSLILGYTLLAGSIVLKA